jgi:hypothetical protein
MPSSAVMPAVQPLVFELRCALRVCTSGITAFGCSTVGVFGQCARCCCTPHRCWGRYIASASQVLVSALARRCGVASLAHRAGTAIACGSAWSLIDVRRFTPATGTHCVALRVYIGRCFVKWLPVTALRCVWCHPPLARPGGFTKLTLCKVPPLGCGRVSHRRSPVASRPTRRRLCALVSCWRWGIGKALRALAFSQWPAASHHVCAPPTLWASPLRGIGPARPARPPPRGSLSPAPGGHSRACCVVAIKYIAACAHSARATGRNGL